MKARHLAIGCGITLVGCTFAGLTDYQVAECNPARIGVDDECRNLNTDLEACRFYQCDPGSRRCVLGARDLDRDGDPSVRCGGTDCDDGDALRSGKRTETCDSVDNDCNGVVDDGLVVPKEKVARNIALTDLRAGRGQPRLSPSDGTEIYATYLGTAAGCVHGFALGTGPADGGGACLSVEADASVREPERLAIGTRTESTNAVAYVEEHPASGCTKEQLAFATQQTGGQTFLADCGAALPALVSFPKQAEALVAFYDVRTADRADPLRDCATAAPAPLKLRWVDLPTTRAPDLVTSPASTLGTGTAMRPPALLPLVTGTSVLLASPIETSAGLWNLTADGQIVPLAPTIPALANARSVAMAASEDQLAIVAEQGCPPMQSITMVIAELSPVNGALVLSGNAPSFRAVTVADAPRAAATAPSVTWVAGQREWWVAWIDQRQKAMLRRVAADGSALDGERELGDGAAATVRSAGTGSVLDGGVSGAPVAYVLRPDGQSVDEIALGCKP